MKLSLQVLESRDNPMTCTWTATGAGWQDWTNAGNWKDDIVPDINDDIVLEAGSSDIKLYGQYGSITSAAGDQINILVEDGNTLDVAGGSLTSSTTKTTVTLESNSNFVISGEMTLVNFGVNNSGGLAENCRFWIDGLLNIGNTAGETIEIDKVPLTVTSYGTLNLMGNATGTSGKVTFVTAEGVENFGTINFSSMNPGIFNTTLLENYYKISSRPSVGTGVTIQGQVVNYTDAEIVVGYSTTLMTGKTNSTPQSGFTNYGYVRLETDGNAGASISLLGNSNGRGDYNDYGTTIVDGEDVPANRIGDCGIVANQVNFDNNTVQFYDTLGKGVLVVNAMEGVYVSSTVFIMNYSSTTNSTDLVRTNKETNFATAPTFKVGVYGNTNPKAGTFDLFQVVLLAGNGLTGATASQGSPFPSNCNLKQDADHVWMEVKNAKVQGLAFNDGYYVLSTSTTYGIDTYVSPSEVVPGIEVRLYDADTNELVATTLTGGGGLYEFDQVWTGNYYLAFIGFTTDLLVPSAYTPEDPGVRFIYQDGASFLTSSYTDENDNLVALVEGIFVDETDLYYSAGAYGVAL